MLKDEIVFVTSHAYAHAMVGRMAPVGLVVISTDRNPKIWEEKTIKLFIDC
ncbi:MAG TPA: hypothetical protein P5514_11450 [Bacteroidales bacterium]|nr:hypothetical protein [Bacteroidales bacterium]HRX97553.1 hypothetical protein [Bacteroidales bacterium]